MTNKYSFMQKLRIRFFGSVPLELRMRPGWKEPIMFYAFNCPKHGIVEDYPHGHGQRLMCMKCLEAKWK